MIFLAFPDERPKIPSAFAAEKNLALPHHLSAENYQEVSTSSA